MKIFSATKTSLLSALAASACCLPALILLAFSIGSATLGAVLARYHWWFLGVGLALLAVSYVLFFRERKACSSSGCRMRNRGVTLFSLTFATIVIGALAVNSLMPLFSHAAKHPTKPLAAGQARIIIPIEGMTCFSCEIHVKKVLKDIPGVVDAVASVADKSVTVTFRPSQVTRGDLVETLNTKTGYKAWLPSAGSE